MNHNNRIYYQRLLFQCIFWLFPILNTAWIYLCATAFSVISYLRGEPFPWHSNLADCFSIENSDIVFFLAFWLFQIICLLINYGYSLMLFLLRERYWLMPSIYIASIIAAIIVQMVALKGEYSTGGYIGIFFFDITTMAPSVIVPYLLKRKLDNLRNQQ